MRPIGYLWYKCFNHNDEFLKYRFVGMYFSSGSSKRRLDYYLTFLQAYYWFKRQAWGDVFPPQLEHLYKDTLSNLRPKLKLCQNYEEAQAEVENIRTQLGIGVIVSLISFNRIFLLNLFSDRLIGDVSEGEKDDSMLESIAETDNEDGGDDEASEGVTGPITDDATEDETADQGSDDEGQIYFVKKCFFLFNTLFQMC